MKILITDLLHDSFEKGFSGAEFKYDYDALPEEWPILYPETQVLVVRNKKVSENTLLGFSHLQCIGRAGAGMDNIDLKAAEKYGIKCVHAGGANAPAVAEHTLGMALSLLNHLHSAHQEVVQSQWKREYNRGKELRKLTWGIYGFGNTGEALGKLLIGMGMHIISFDKYRDPLPKWANATTKETLLSSSDIISLHIPLTAETNGMVNDEWFEGVKKGSILINVSRGEIAPIKNVLKALDDDLISCLGLDVLDQENPKEWDDAYCQWIQKAKHDRRILLTPHVAGWTQESYVAISQVLADRILQVLNR